MGMKTGVERLLTVVMVASVAALVIVLLGSVGIVVKPEEDDQFKPFVIGLATAVALISAIYPALVLMLGKPSHDPSFLDRHLQSASKIKRMLIASAGIWISLASGLAFVTIVRGPGATQLGFVAGFLGPIAIATTVLAGIAIVSWVVAGFTKK